MKTYRQSLFRSSDFWGYIAGIYIFLLLSRALRPTGVLILGGVYTVLFVLHLAQRNEVALCEGEIRIENPYTLRTLRYPYNRLEKVEFINDRTRKPRIRLKTRDGKIRWHNLEGIRGQDYRPIIAHLKAAGVAVETVKMKPWLKRG